MPKISVMFGSNVESEYTLKKDEIKIGRAMDCDIVVDNLGVSRHHCTIVHEGDDWVVVDGGSNNGTYVGGQKIKRHALKHADRVVLGKHSLLYDAHGEAEASAEKKGGKKTAGGMGGEMTMFVDQAQLAKVMSTKRMGLSLMQSGRELLVPLIREETTIGSSGADVPAKAWLVKPIQAKVVKSGEAHRIISLGGWRGVYVNGQKVVSSLDLKSGDIITIAGHTLTYKQA
jgi:pSer/pThr/pTyr-binding forkhead associated (FHA) protein